VLVESVARCVTRVCVSCGFSNQMVSCDDLVSTIRSAMEEANLVLVSAGFQRRHHSLCGCAEGC
jgi:hypothetical protein